MNYRFSLLLMLLLCLAPACADTTVPANDGSFWVQLPDSFGPVANPAGILDVEMPGGSVSLICKKGEAVELEPELFAEKQKRMLFDNGAQIFGTASSTLAGKPACSFLVGGVKEGKESLFVFNQREDAVYVFVLNYPTGQRQDAARLWNQIAPTFKFASKKK